MLTRLALVVVSSAIFICDSVASEGEAGAMKYQALRFTPPPSAGTWAILERDGANRQVAKYLSSLCSGETGTGSIASPAFRLEADRVSFTIFGHDGPGGEQNRNFLALVDARKGTVLKQTPAPGSDAMQERHWDVASLRGREVRIDARDGDAGGAFAWMGVGRIDAGDALRVDFSKGLPEGWTVTQRPVELRTEVVRGGVPFLRYPAVYTMIPNAGTVEIPCGFAAERVFVLGCTIPWGAPGETYGWIEMVRRGGAVERVPLVYGFTLDMAGKLLSTSKACYLHASADAFQHYLVLDTRGEAIEKLVLRRNSQHGITPQITAITCLTAAESQRLAPLPEMNIDPDESAWIEAHAIAPDRPNLDAIRAEIRRIHRLAE